MVSPLLRLLVGPTKEHTVFRLPQSPHSSPGPEYRHGPDDHVYPIATLDQGQAQPHQENYPLCCFLTGYIRHPLLHPIQVLLDIESLRRPLGRLVRPRSSNRDRRGKYSPNMDPVPPDVQLEVLLGTLVI